MKPSEFIKEEFSTDDEYSGEVSMVKNNLHTIVRASVDLAKELKNDEDLPEWVEEKISLAKGMMVTVDFEVNGINYSNVVELQKQALTIIRGKSCYLLRHGTIRCGL